MSDKSLFYRGFEGNTEIEDFFERFQEYAEANETGNSVSHIAPRWDAFGPKLK